MVKGFVDKVVYESLSTPKAVQIRRLVLGASPGIAVIIFSHSGTSDVDSFGVIPYKHFQLCGCQVMPLIASICVIGFWHISIICCLPILFIA